METTYAMIGSDGQQYGPITLAQMRTWIGEGRIAASTQIWRSDTNAWLPASQYVELGLGQPTPPPPLPGRVPAGAMSDPQLERRVRLGARWFFWIAGLSAINAFTVHSRQGIVFLVGLAVTQVISGAASQLGSGGEGLGIALIVLAAGAFAMFGFFAWKRHSWSFIAGMVLYAADGALAALHQAWLPVAFHAFVLFWLFLGLRACLKIPRGVVLGQRPDGEAR